jgi:hypothetical protein
MVRQPVDPTTRALQTPWHVQATTGLDKLRREWRRLYDHAPPGISRNLLILGIAYRHQEIEHGGLGTPVRKRATA